LLSTCTSENGKACFPHRYAQDGLAGDNRLSQFTPKYKPYRLLKKFDDVFGRENVQFHNFDPKTFPNGCVVAHFCTNIGLEPVPSANVNVTISRPAVSALYGLNRELLRGENYVHGYKKARIALIRQFPHQAWPKFRLSPDVIAPLFERNIADLQWIEERIGCSLRTKGKQQDHDVCSEADLLHIHQGAIQ
jgi:hypothetical protein